MAAIIRNFPLSNIVDGIISYLQFMFGNEDVTPDEYRWLEDDRKTKIRISGVFVVDDEKPFSAPFIVVERGGFQKDDRIIDNLKKADANTFENKEGNTIWDGSVNIIFGARSGPEASSLANFVATEMDADRKGLLQTLTFVRNIRSMTVGPEIPTKKRDEIIRWSVTLTVFVSIQMGWRNELIDPVKANHITLKHIAKQFMTESATGETTEGSDTLIDNTKSFGFTTGDDPQLIQKEFEDGWYYVRFDTKLYKVTEIVDEHTLKLVNWDDYNAEIPWEAPATATNVSYQLLWNSIHLSIQVP